MPPFDPKLNDGDALNKCFVADQKAAVKYCTAASEATAAGDSPQAIRLLLQALTVRPSCMLSYQLLSDISDNQGHASDAALCRKGELPDRLLDLLPAAVNVGSTTGATGLANLGIKRHNLFASERIDLPAPGEVLQLSGKLPGKLQAQSQGQPHSQSPKSAKPAFFSERSIVSKECFVDQIKDARLWHDAQHTLVLDANGNEVVEHSKSDRGLIQCVMNSHEAKHIEGRAFLVGARGAHNFYHWMADIAPKLAALNAAGFSFVAADRFVVPFASAGFCKQVVEQFGIDPVQLYETEKQHTYLKVDELVVPYVENKMGLTMGDWLPQLMQKQFTPTAIDVSSSRRLFVTRDANNSDGRQLENQEELIAHLQQYDFEFIQPEKYSVQQQAQLFSEASVVVGAHGAALSNIMFCKAGTTVIEFYGAHLAPCYWAISALCKLHYFHHYSASSTTASHGTAAGRSGNLSVLISELDDLLSVAGVLR